MLERRKRIATALDWGAVIDDGSGLNSTDLKACLTKWVLAQFKPAQPLPPLCSVRPLSHPSPNQRLNVDHWCWARCDTDCHGKCDKWINATPALRRALPVY